jgi:hypothetical protein
MLLLASTLDLFLRRLTRTAGRPRLRAPIYATILVVGTGASAWFSYVGYRDAASALPTEASFSGLVALGVAFLTAGPIILLVDGARDRSGQFQRCVASLPLSSRRLAALAWFPPALFGAVVVGWLTPPTLLTLLGSGVAPAAALGFTLVPLALGAVSALLALSVSSLVLRGARWDVARPPVAYLLWVATVVVELMGCLEALEGRHDPATAWLLLPRVALALATGTEIDPGTIAISAAVLGGVVLLAWLGSRGRNETQRQRSVRREWRGRSRLVGDLVYVLRDANMTANILSALVLCSVTAVLLNRLPPELQSGAFRAGATIICLCAAVPCRGIRGIHPVRPTAARLLRVSVVGWVVRHTVIATLLFLGLALPLWLLPGPRNRHTVALAVAIALTALACSILVGSVFVVRADNSLGQVMGALMLITIGGAAEWAIGGLDPVAALTLASAAYALACVFAIVLERARWTYRSGHRPAH